VSTAVPREDRNSARHDLLSDEEERALSQLRDIIAGLRAFRPEVEVASMEQGIRAAGGKRVYSSERDGPDTFVLGGACFTLSPSLENPGKIEVVFTSFLK
jgi:hypothetical protein